MAPAECSCGDGPLDRALGRPRHHCGPISAGAGGLAKSRLSGLRHGYLPGSPGDLLTGTGHPPGGRFQPPGVHGAFFDIALRALAMTDPALHFQMPTARDTTAAVSDLGYADDLVSLSLCLLRTHSSSTSPSPPPNSVQRAWAPLSRTRPLSFRTGMVPTTIPVRTHGSILGLTRVYAKHHFSCFTFHFSPSGRGKKLFLFRFKPEKWPERGKFSFGKNPPY